MRRRSRRAVGVGATVLAVVIAVIGVVHAVGPGTEASVPNGLATVTRDDGGVRLTLGTLPGPYFASELLPVTLTLTNDSGATIPYVGTLPPGLCAFPALDMRLSSGGQDVRDAETITYPDDLTARRGCLRTTCLGEGAAEAGLPPPPSRPWLT